MKSNKHSISTLLCLAIALLTAVTAGTGLLLRGDNSFETITSVRGEEYQMAATGVYVYNALRVVAEGIGWDVFTLVFAVPALLIVLPFLHRGSLRGQLFAIGILAYLFYQYLMYAMAWAFGPLFLLFILIYSLSLVAIVLIISTIDITTLDQRFSAKFPRRGMSALCFVLAAFLILMWLQRILTALDGNIEGILLGQTTLVVQALDLGLIVPLAIFTGVSALRGRPIGYLLCSTVVVKAVAMAIAICAMLFSAWAYEGTLEIAPLLLFAAAAGVSFWLGVRMYRSILPQ